MDIGELKEAIYTVTELGGAWGRNMDVSKDVLVEVHGHLFPLSQVAASFVEGRFVLVLHGKTS